MKADAARIIFDWLYERDMDGSIPQTKLIMGFGAFSMGIPKKCLELYKAGKGGFIIFSGGVGFGADFGGVSEAEIFRTYLLEQEPSFDTGKLLIESKSTSTVKNVQFTGRLLLWRSLIRNFYWGIDKAIAVAQPYRTLRVRLIVERFAPRVRWFVTSMETTFEKERKEFLAVKRDFAKELAKEVEVIGHYNSKGTLNHPIPREIVKAHDVIGQQYDWATL